LSIVLSRDYLLGRMTYFSLICKVMKRMKKVSRLVLFLIAFLSVFFLSLFFKIDFEPEFSIQPDLQFDYRYEQFFPKDDADLNFFEEYREKFESDNDFLNIGLLNHEGLFQRDFLLRLDSLTKDLEALPSVVSVKSITNITYPKLGFEGIKEEPFIHLNGKSWRKDSLNLYQHEALLNTLVSSDFPATSILIKTEDYLPRKKSDPLIKAIKALKKKYSGFDEFHVAGRIVAQSHYMLKLGTEMALFMSISIVLLIAFLWVTFRSWWGVVIPLIVVLLSILWTMTFMKISGKAFDLLTVLMPTIIFVVGMSDVIHILSKYLEELRKGVPKYDALKKSFTEVGFATFLTSFTTAVGFYALLIATIQPIKDFGWYTGAGVFISYGLAFSLFPAVLLNVKTPKIVLKERKTKGWDTFLLKSFIKLLRYRKQILIANIVLIVLAVVFASQVRIENYLLEDLSESDPVKQDVQFFEDKLSGVRPVEISVILKEGEKLWSAKTLKEFNKLQDYLRNEYEISALLSPVSVVKGVNQTLRGGRSRFYRFPKSDEQLEKVISFIEKNLNKNQIKNQLKLVVSNDGTIRFSGKVADFGATVINRRNSELYAYVEKEVLDDLMDLRVTGTADLIDKNNEYLSENMLLGLILAFFVIGLIVTAIFKSFSMLLITWFVNLIPLLIVAGVMGLVSIDLRISTSLIFSIAFGIAVDDTIHFLTRYKMELRQGRTNLYAIKRSFISTGKAIIMTSIMLCAGFVTLLGSNFMSTYYIGLLVSITLLFAVLIDMTLLPILLMYRKKV